MHLALVIDDYLPHSTRVGAKMFHELAVQYIKLGHQVTVITPDSQMKTSFVEDELNGVTVWRFANGEIKDTSKVKRAINETLLSFNAWKLLSPKISNNYFDGIIYYSPSIFFGYLIKKLKQRCQCSAYLVLRDLFPQWVVDAGIVKSGSLIEKYFRYFESKSYDQADMIGLMSEKNESIFNKMTHGNYPTEVLRNWADLNPYNGDNTWREKLGLENKVIYFYGGNIGHAQDMSNLMRLVKGMQQYPRAHFLFVGQGDEVSLINNLAKEWQLDNYTYLPSINQTEFKKLLAEVDVGLFSLSAAHTAHNFPGKLLGYMVQPLPILGSVNDGNDLLELVNNYSAGFISVNGQDALLLERAILLLDLDTRKNIGNNAFKLLQNEFSVNECANKIISKFIL